LEERKEKSLRKGMGGEGEELEEKGGKIFYSSLIEGGRGGGAINPLEGVRREAM